MIKSRKSYNPKEYVVENNFKKNDFKKSLPNKTFEI